MLRRIRDWYEAHRRLRLTVIGMNRRNRELVIPGNPRESIHLVNDKVQCKQLLDANGIPVARTIAVCETRRDLDHLGAELVNHNSFAIKPARGFGGEGILLIVKSDERGYFGTDGTLYSRDDLLYHAGAIMDGAFSLDNYSDKALVEELIVPDPAMTKICGAGAPDIRVIVLNERVIAAMLRLPTRLSGGKANLHQGGVGLGIDIKTGLTTSASLRGRAVEAHPDTGVSLCGIPVPQWSNIMETSPRIPSLFGLQFAGIDYITDLTRGTLVLEVNARPGLQIQVANLQGLRPIVEETLHAQK
jgi:alpha-L-glutamate ligase-like protein